MSKISAKEAAERAKVYLHDLVGVPNHLITLEEIELEEDIWMRTLGYPKDFSLISGMLGASAREYKIFRVTAVSGEVISMKIRVLGQEPQ